MGKTKRPCLECRRLFFPDRNRPSYCADCHSKFHNQLKKQQVNYQHKPRRKDTRKKGSRPYDTAAYRRYRSEMLGMATHCLICNKPRTLDDPLHVDHIVPISKGGTNEPGNLRPVHRSCNIRKKDKYGLIGIR